MFSGMVEENCSGLRSSRTVSHNSDVGTGTIPGSVVFVLHELVLECTALATVPWPGA